MNLLPYALQKNQHDSYYLQSVAAGQQYLDALRSAVEANQPQPPFPSITIDAGFSVVDLKTKNPSAGTFDFTGSSCAPAQALSTLHLCTVSVSWTENGQARSYTTQSFATQQVSK